MSQDRKGDKPQDGRDGRADNETRDRQPVPIKPVSKRIGESDDNLDRRAEWFRRRSGTAGKPRQG